MGYEYQIRVSAKRSDVEAKLGRFQGVRRDGDQFVFSAIDPAGWPDATAQLNEEGIYFLANSSEGKLLLGNLLVALASLGPVRVEEL